ncbi:MAG: tetratricopeptide repeat protein [Pseudomonadota bacterium]
MDDEKEQLDDMRAWWSEYGGVVLGGIVIGALALFGYSYMKSSTADSEIAASALYDELADYAAEGDLDDAERIAETLSSEYGDSLYALQSKLALARLYMDNNRDQDAADALRELVDSRQSPALAAVARLRLAKVLQYQEKYDEILTLLDGQDSTGFTARYAEARGDALVALSRFDEAREAYLLALADNGQTVDTTFLQLKLIDLPVTTAVAAADGEVVTDDMTDTPAADNESADDDANTIEPSDETEQPAADEPGEAAE